jgi:hypothetical protein
MRVAWLLIALAGQTAGAEPPAEERPVMTALPPAAASRQPPSSRELVDARAELQRRHRELLFRATTSTGADLAAEALAEAGAAEKDRALQWALYAEARRLGVASGNAAVISRAITLATASFDFDALEMEHRTLAEIPLRGVSPQRAMRLAEAAENLATRAEADGRRELALAAQDLAIKAWQRTGAREAARRAMVRHTELGGP